MRSTGEIAASAGRAGRPLRPDAVSAAGSPMTLVAPVPTTTKAPTPSQILLLVFMSNPGDDFQNFVAPYLTRPRAISRGASWGDAYNRDWHPSSHLLVFNYSNEKDWAVARERLPGHRHRVFDRCQTAEDP